MQSSSAISLFLAKSTLDYLRGRRTVSAQENKSKSDQIHLRAAVTWLMRSIEVCGGHASSKGYRFMRGWMPPYPETSGYIIPTLLTLANELGDPVFEQHARKIGDWLVEIQLDNGGFTGREVGVQDAPDVFDTGMILLGLNALILTEHNDRWLQTARRASDFLISAIDRDGCFVRNCSHNMIHTYNVRSAWALLAFGLLTSDKRFQQAALRNIRWTLSQQLECGFFVNNAFKPGGNANTHGTAYVLRGLLQSYQLTGKVDLLAAVLRAAEPIISQYTAKG